MKKIILILPIVIFNYASSQNISINTDGTSAETGVMLDVKGTNPKTTTLSETGFQIKSLNTSTNELKMRLILHGDAAGISSRYAQIDAADYTAGTPTYVNFLLQPSGGNVGIGTTNPSEKLEIFGGTGNGRMQVSVSSANPIIYLNGDATNGYYPSIDFRPLGNSSLGGSIQSFSTQGGLIASPRGGPFVSQQYDQTKSMFQALAQNTNHTANYFETKYVNAGNYWLTSSLTPVGATDQRMQFFLYNTIETAPTNYERLAQYADATNNIFRIEAQKGGTGTLRNIVLQAGGGNVGIGNLTPGAKLTMNQSSNGYANGTVIYGNGINGQYIALSALAAGQASVQSGDNTTWQNLLLNPNGGNVGIGSTTSPTAKLQINASNNPDAIWFGTGSNTYPSTPSAGINLVGKSTTSDFRLSLQDGNGRINNYWNAYMDGTIKYIVNNEPAARMLMSISTSGVWSFYGAPSSGASGAGTTVSWTQGAYIEPHATAGSIWFSPRGTNTDFYMSSAGNVGIGTTSPGTKLEVDGTSGTTLKIVDGNQAAGKVLTSDAAGVASWSNPAAGTMVLLYSNEPQTSGFTYGGVTAFTYNVVGTFSQVKVEADIENDCSGGASVSLQGWQYKIVYNGVTKRTAQLLCGDKVSNDDWLSGHITYMGAVANGQTVKLDILNVGTAGTWYASGFRVWGIY